MQWSLVAVVLIVNAIIGVSSANAENVKEQISSAFEAFGYSPSCVASALTSCEERSVHFVDSIEGIKSLLQELKSDQKNISNSLEDMKALLQEMKMKHEKATEEIINPRMNCADLQVLGDELSGVRTLYPYGVSNSSEAIVYCDQVTDGGGWTVIQSRSPLPIRENFNRNWDEYAEGFGDPNGEFWLGLDNIHALTNAALTEMRVDLETWEGAKAWAKYGTFHVGDAASKYVLRIEGYTGDAGDGMTYPTNSNFNLNSMKFSTQDNENDHNSGGNCAKSYEGGWWFNYCSAAHLNGLHNAGENPKPGGIIWSPFRDLSFNEESGNENPPRFPRLLSIIHSLFIDCCY